MNELRKIKDKLVRANVKFRKKQKELVVTERYKQIMDNSGIEIVF